MTDVGLLTSAEVGGGVPSYAPDVPLPKITTKEEFEAFPAGRDYIDPEGNKHTKPYSGKTLDEFNQVPEGADYLNPEGHIQTKPVYQGVGFTAQYLFDAAADDETREKALRAVYGDKVKKGPTGVYIDDEGVLRKPNHGGLGGELAHAAAETAPAIGMTLGGLAGGTAGTVVEPGGGTAAGAFGGMVLGAMEGRQFNNMMLELAGVHQPISEQIKSAGYEGLAAASGDVIGAAGSKIAPAVRATKGYYTGVYNKLGGLKENLANVLEDFGVTPERARYFFGTTPETAARNASIATRSGRGAPPSVFAPEAPGLKKIEEFDAVFRAQNVFGEHARDFYEQEARKILENEKIGVKVSTPLTAAEQKVSSESAGRAVITAARHDMAHADAMLENAMRDMHTEIRRPIEEAGGEAKVAAEHQTKLERLQKAQEAASYSAKMFVNESLSQLRDYVKSALSKAAGTEDPSGLLRMTAAAFRSYTAAIKSKANLLYQAADSAAGEHLPNTQPLVDDAEAFLRAMPEVIKSKYPVEISQIAKLAGKEAEEGKEAVSATDLTFGQLHQLRSWLRYGIDYNDLTPDMRQGSLKFFEHKVDAALHDAEAAPELKQAAKMLDTADKFYKENIPYLDDQMVRTTIDALKSGAGANPEFIARTFFDPARTEAMRKARTIVGENLWRGVEAADTKSMLDHSKTLTPGLFDGKKFSMQVLDRLRNGVLENGYSPELARKVAKIAADIEKVEGTLPINVSPDDTVSSLMRKAQVAAQEAEELAARDPITALSNETARLTNEYNNAKKILHQLRKAQPLGFLYEESFSQKFVKAADRILGNQDLIMAAANKFGRGSEEFKGLQKVYVLRFFQRGLGSTAKMREELGGEKGMTEEMQALMFPGTTRKMMLQLVEDMEFLFSGGGADVGGSMAAAARVLNPMAHVPIPMTHGLGSYLTMIPGVTIGARFALGKLFATIMDGVSHPNFANWLAGNLRGTATQKIMARQLVRDRLRLGGWFGAAGGQLLYGQNR